jgi:HTH-type transcriptional regulator, sugar sensing transcriptional regulator
MDTTPLEDIGLTASEIKVYLALLEIGQASAGAILERAKVQNSVFHLAVNALIEKGLVSYVKKNKFRLYSAADPKTLLLYVKDKEKEIENMLPILEERQKRKDEKQEVELFEGIQGIITLMNLIIENSRKGDEFLFFSADEETYTEQDEIQRFYQRYDVKRRDKGLTVKGIAPKRMKQFFVHRTLPKMKYTNAPIPPNTAICNNYMALITWGKNPSGLLIKSNSIADKQRNFFNALWNSKFVS